MVLLEDCLNGRWVSRRRPQDSALDSCTAAPDQTDKVFSSACGSADCAHALEAPSRNRYRDSAVQGSSSGADRQRTRKIAYDSSNGHEQHVQSKK